jgi:biotin transport system substrate-specific component
MANSVKIAWRYGDSMNNTRSFGYINTGKGTFYDWIASPAWTKKLILSMIFAGLSGISAQVRIPLPWTPVPVTGQVLVVLLSGIFLGRTFGGLSMTWYVALGMAGLPWFTGGRPGLPFGPTSGYIIGFIPAAVFVGNFVQKHRGFLEQLILMLCAVAIIYIFGAVNFAFFARTGVRETLVMAVFPFIALDLLKALVAASISKAILPSQN